MMVIAVRGQQSAKVSKSFYEKVLKKKGFKIAGETEEKVIYSSEPDENTEEEMQEHETEANEDVKDEKDDIDSIPISEMNKAQLMQFAKKHNIDTKSAKNVPEARRIIQKAVREAKM